MTERSHVALTQCFYCLGPGTILLATRYIRTADNKTVPRDDLSPAHGKVVDMTPCSKCEDLMKRGIILITIDADKSEMDWNIPPPAYTGGRKRSTWVPNPYRTGGWFVVTADAIRRMLPTEMADWALKNRFMFIEHAAAEQIGLFTTQPTETEDA